MDETSGVTDWFLGTVLGVVRGLDGDPDTVYDVLYEVDDVYEDYTESAVQFTDL